ncbi:MAG TPA: SHOCT domain-containing protein [Pseudonocardiaceae bacterium]|nr:SHOCT domain-containing protein [Pseudonocardiaceae bacterium]
MREQLLAWWHGGPGDMGWGPAWWGVSMLALLAIGVGVAFFLTRRQPPIRAGYPPYQPPYQQSPEDMLAARFARGEIAEEEYLSRLATLRGGQSG